MATNALDMASHLKDFATKYKYGDSSEPLFGNSSGEVNQGGGVGYRGWRFLNNLIFALMLKEYANPSDISVDTLIQDSKKSLVDYLKATTEDHAHPHRGFTNAMAVDAINDLTSKLQGQIREIKDGKIKPESLSPTGYYNRPVPMLSAGQGRSLDGKGLAGMVAAEARQL